MIENMQDSFTNELYITSKNNLEKIAQDNFDITLHIKNCVKNYSIRFKASIDIIVQNYYNINGYHINIDEQKYYITNGYLNEKTVRSTSWT